MKTKTNEFIKKAMFSKNTKCDVSRCSAECCGAVPLSQSFKKYPFVRKCEVRDFDDFFIATDENLTCGFLDENYKCSIYEVRPNICRKFGSGKHKLLTCDYLQ